MRFFLGLILSTALFGCGGGGGSAGPAPLAAGVAGVYSGTSTDTSGTYTVVGAIAPNGTGVFLNTTDNTIFRVNLSGGPGNISGGFIAFANVDGNSYSVVDLFAGAGDVAGNFAGSLLSGTLTSAPDTATFSLNREAVDSSLTSGLSTLSGTWRGDDGPSDFTSITIGSGGVISGTDNDGCVYSGSVSLPRAGLNVYLLNLNANCPSEPTLSADGLLIRTVDGSVQTIIIGISDAQFALFAELTKQ